MAINFSGVSYSSLLYLDLVPIKPMGNPSPNLHYIDFIYDDKLYQRRLKIEKIMKKCVTTNSKESLC